MTELGLGKRLDAIESLLRELLTQAARAVPLSDAEPRIIWKHGRRPNFWKDAEVRSLAIGLWRQTTVDDARARIASQCGDRRTPSRAALHRFWQSLDKAKRA